MPELPFSTRITDTNYTDRMTAQPANYGDNRGVYIALPTDVENGWLSESGAREFGAWLNRRYSLPAWSPSDGEEVRVLSGARSATDGDLPTDATSAVVINGTWDRDGDVRVRITDGTRRGDTTHVLPRYLAPLDALPVVPEWPPAVGDVVRLLPTASRFYGARSPLVGSGTTRVEVSHPLDEDGEYEVKALDGAKAGTGGYYVMLSGLAPLDTTTAEPDYVPGTPMVITSADAVSALGVRANVPAGTPAVVVRQTVAGAYAVNVWRDGELCRVVVKPEFLARSMPAQPAGPVELRRGDIVELKPGAKTAHGHSVYFAGDVTRVRVLETTDGSYDYWVVNLNGSGAQGDTVRAQYVGRVWLGEVLPDTWQVGDLATVTEDRPSLANLSEGDLVRVTAVFADGQSLRVALVSNPRGRWSVSEDQITRPSV